MKERRHHISTVLFCLYILAVCLLCFTRPDNIPAITFDLFGLPADKAVHLLMFIPFPVLAGLAFIPERYGNFRKALCLVAIAAIGAATAIATEKIQGMLGYRSFEIKDLTADLIGISVGAAAMLIHYALKTKRK